MADDLRHYPSGSSEGVGRARKVWETYAEAANRIRPRWWDEAAQRLGTKWAEELVGFWVSWHLYGGFDGLKQAGWGERTIYRKLKRFRLVFGKHPDDYRIIGIDLDPEAFWKAYLDPERDEE
jgi:hypothetical protein